MKITGNCILFTFLLAICDVFFISAQEEINPNGYNKLYHPNGILASEGTMRNGKPDGYWKTYYPTGVIKSEGNRVNFILDGPWIFYTGFGDTAQLINYYMGSKNGYLYTYYTNRSGNMNFIGNVVSRELYVNDLKEGESFYYFDNGSLMEETEFRNSKKHGKSLEYDNADGRIITIKTYNNGALVERTRINRYNNDGEKSGLWQEFYENGRISKEMTYADGKLNGYYKEFDEGGKLIVSLRYENDLLVQEIAEEDDQVDMEKKFDDKGNLVFAGAYKNDIPIGIHREYTINGEVKSAIIYNEEGNVISKGIVTEEGEKEGLWNDFYASGEIRAEGNYKNNKREGKWKFYFINGKIEQTGEYKNGMENGIWLWYYQNGDIWIEEEYYNGLEEGQYTEYDNNGKIIVSGEYYDGEKEGKWETDVGDQIEEGNYVIGLRDGKWKYYYSNGDLKFEGNFIQGNPDGKHVYFYPGNILKEEQYFVSGLKEKHWKKYDEYGELIITISYKDDKEYRINGVKIDLGLDEVVLIK